MLAPTDLPLGEDYAIIDEMTSQKDKEARFMSEQRRKHTDSRKGNPFFATPLATVLTCMLAFLAIGLFIKCVVDLVDAIPEQPNTHISSTTTEPTETEEGAVTVISSATVSSQGDLLMHKPVIETCVDAGGNYDFSSIFRYVKDYVSGYDYAVANLETTLGGPSFPYQGNPSFNTPDSFADTLVKTGFDMLLTANNHCADTTATGIVRTLEQLRSRNLATVGTQKDASEPDFLVVEVGGIRLGIGCYTYATDETDDGRPSLNRNSFLAKSGIVNYYMENKLDRFYGEVEAQLSAMEQQGVDATIYYIHWGVEYETEENELQNKMAQKLCDMGVDVIIGGHPHVVQPVELLQSTRDPSHRTVCIYSLGNVVSNQREGIDPSFEGGYTEDGAIFNVTFEKYSDGTVGLAAVEVLPTWVNMHTTNGVKEYNVLPLDMSRESQWKDMFGISDETAQKAKDSYDRTMKIVGDGLEECQKFLENARNLRLYGNTLPGE